MLLKCGIEEDSWESLGLQGDSTSPSSRRSVPGVHWKGWCWSWNSNILATWCEELTHWKRPWCWERLTAGGEGNDRGWDDWMASLTQWTWVWVDSGSWWWPRRPSVLWFMGCKELDMTEQLNWNWNSVKVKLQRRQHDDPLEIARNNWKFLILKINSHNSHPEWNGPLYNPLGKRT